MSAPRWRCPQCHGTNVQVSYPTWYRERADYELELVETDVGAEILYWYCDDCDTSDGGSPEEVAP